MRSGSSISSEAEHRNERQANETALLSDYKLRSLAETHRCRLGNDVAARRLHPDSDEAGSTSLRTLQDLGRGNTPQSGRANLLHRCIPNSSLWIYPSLAIDWWTATWRLCT